MQPLSKQNPVAVDSAATGRVASSHTPDWFSAWDGGGWLAAPETVATREWFWNEFTRLAGRWDATRHPFHRRWTDGELSRGELASYAEEYEQLVLTIAELSRRAAAKADGLLALALTEHARVEQDHIECWRRFAQGVGWLPELSWGYAAEPEAATLECARVWLGAEDRPLAQDLLTLYAVEWPQTELAATQLAGLMRYYGLDDGPATEYFRLHLDADNRQAAVARVAIEQMFTETDPFALLTQAEAVHRAYWHMLEAIEEDHHR